MNEKPTIAHCPFCKCTSVSVDPLESCAAYDINGEFIHSYYSVFCDNCDAAGPIADTAEQAIIKWNAAAKPERKEG